MLHRIAVTTALLAAASAPAFAQAGPDASVPPAATAGQPLTKLPNDSVDIARRFSTWFWSTQVDSLIAHSPRDTSVTRTQMIDQITSFIARAGVETAVVEERWVRRNGRRQYWRVSRFSDFADEPLVLRLVLLSDGRFAGIGLNPLSQVPPTEPEVP